MAREKERRRRRRKEIWIRNGLKRGPRYDRIWRRKSPETAGRSGRRVPGSLVATGSPSFTRKLVGVTDPSRDVLLTGLMK